MNTSATTKATGTGTFSTTTASGHVGTGNGSSNATSIGVDEIDYYDRDRRIALGVVSAFLATVFALAIMAGAYYYVLKRARTNRSKERVQNRRSLFSIPYGRKPALPPKPTAAKKKPTTPFKTASRPAHTIHYSIVTPATSKHTLNSDNSGSGGGGEGGGGARMATDGRAAGRQHEQLKRGATRNYHSTSLTRVAANDSSGGSSSYYEPLSTGPGTRSNSTDDLLDQNLNAGKPRISDDVFTDVPRLQADGAKFVDAPLPSSVSRLAPLKPRRSDDGGPASRNELCLANELLLTMHEEDMRAAPCPGSPKTHGSPATGNGGNGGARPGGKRSGGPTSMLPMGLDYDEDALLETLRHQQQEGSGTGYATDDEILECSIYGTVQLILRFDTSRVFHVMVKCLNDLPSIGRSAGGAGKDAESSSSAPAAAAMPNAFVKIRLLPDRSAKCKTRVIKRCASPIYNEEFLFAGYSMTWLQRAKLQVQVFHYDLLSKRQMIGELAIPLRQLNLSRGVTLWRGLNEPRQESRSS